MFTPVLFISKKGNLSIRLNFNLPSPAPLLQCLRPHPRTEGKTAQFFSSKTLLQLTQCDEILAEQKDLKERVRMYIEKGLCR